MTQLTLFDQPEISELDIDALIRQEHRRSELERLRGGLEGCGCALCQEIYKTLELKEYGSRVTEQGGVIAITGGKQGAPLYDACHKPDYWKGNVYFTGGKGYRVTATGATECLGDEAEAIKLAQEENAEDGQGITEKRPARNKRSRFNGSTKYPGVNTRKTAKGKRLPLRARNR